MKKLILILIFALHFFAFSQQDPQYTQYMYNLSVINPAYATGDTGVINLGVMNRSQWVSIEGAPTTYTLFAHTPLSKKIEVGISAISDNIGDGILKENNVYADFAYILQLGETQKLSLGLKAGFTNFETNFSGFRLPDGLLTDDPAFLNQNRVLPNFGVGAFYYTDKFYAGFSAPNFLKTKQLEENNGLNRLGAEEIHFFLTAGYVFKLNSSFKLKPSFLARYVDGSSVIADTSLNILFNNRFEAGVSYRLNDSFSGMFNLRATDNFRIGYAYDYTTSNLGEFNSGSHEIILLFDLYLLSFKKGYDKSPRFF